MTWLLALLVWAALATVVAPVVGRILANAGQPAACPRARRLPTPRSALPLS